MNRTARLKFLATKAGMRHAARVQAIRRGGSDHRYAVGRFEQVDGQVVLHCVEMGAAFDVPRPPRLTDKVSRFCRWRTRQAAHQFACRYRLDCHVLHLGFLDVVRPEASLTR